MSGGSLLGKLFTIVFAIVLLSLVVGQVLGQPILLGYVTTGSMEPTIDAGDGFVAIPAAVTGEPEPGDVVTFEATELHDGGLTTHRIVGEAEGGYVTQGDANPFTDQDGGEPPVTEGQIVASALQVGDTVVTIPHLGTAVMGIGSVLETGYAAVASTLGFTTTPDGEGGGAVLVGLGVVLVGLGALFGSGRDVGRSTARENVLAVRVAIAAVLVVFVAVATVAMVVPAGVYEYEVVSTTEPTDDPQVLAPGESGELARTVDNAGFVPTVAIVEPQSLGIASEPDRLTVGARGEAETTVTLTAPEEEGEYVRHVGEYRYLLVLPPSVLAALHGVHPLVAIAAVDAVVVAVVVVTMVALLGSGDLRFRRPGGNVPARRRLERKLRKWR
ncbi:S26 family signal peptidase [Saliphagus infecundisoli]|uniref:S26 family signal peptidase n=1 Tax=Saliphagus infecundisoli TaxID=1849069 RepID=A0ABD5QEW2_9EURY|nr:S26 family signal peptidase [Saliphagus infecundisoli]